MKIIRVKHDNRKNSELTEKELIEKYSNCTNKELIEELIFYIKFNK